MTPYTFDQPLSSLNLSTPVNNPLVIVSQLETLFHRYMSQSSTSLFVTSCNKSWLLNSACCNHMTPYISDLLSKTGLTDSKTASSPLELNVKLNATDGESLSDVTLYRQLVGNLIYLTVPRPDLAYVVHLVSQFMSASRSTHYAVVLHILWYIKDMLFHGLHFSGQSSLEWCVYVDVDWAGDLTDHRSTTSYCFLLGSSLIS